MKWEFENTTVLDIHVSDVGVNIIALTTIDVTAGNWALWASSVAIDGYLDSGDIVFYLDSVALDAVGAKAVIHNTTKHSNFYLGATPLRSVVEKITLDDFGFTASYVGNNEISIAVNAAGAAFNQYVESDSESSTSSTSFIQKLRLTTPVLVAGNYRIGWHFECNVSSNNQAIEYRVQLDDTVDLALTSLEPRVFEWTGQSGFKRVALTAVAHTIDIDFRVFVDKIASIRRARLEIRRIT